MNSTIETPSVSIANEDRLSFAVGWNMADTPHLHFTARCRAYDQQGNLISSLTGVKVVDEGAGAPDDLVEIDIAQLPYNLARLVVSGGPGRPINIFGGEIARLNGLHGFDFQLQKPYKLGGDSLDLLELVRSADGFVCRAL